MAQMVYLEGMEELKSQLEKLMKQLEADKVEPILLEGAEILAAAERSLAPRGPTGNLARGYHATLLKRLGGMPAAGAGPDYRINPHAHLVEFGTAARRVKKKKVMYDDKTGTFFGTEVAPMPAHPVVRPAWDSNKNRILQTVIGGLKRLVEAVAK